MNWISVTDRLPEIGVAVLGIGLYEGQRTHQSVLILFEDGWFSVDHQKKVAGCVTHWMTLPAPPVSP
ncbi:MAG: DUF551 domain-containing protein [Desulfobacteria bacterium]